MVDAAVRRGARDGVPEERNARGAACRIAYHRRRRTQHLSGLFPRSERDRMRPARARTSTRPVDPDDPARPAPTNGSFCRVLTIAPITPSPSAASAMTAIQVVLRPEQARPVGQRADDQNDADHVHERS